MRLICGEIPLNKLPKGLIEATSKNYAHLSRKDFAEVYLQN